MANQSNRFSYGGTGAREPSAQPLASNWQTNSVWGNSIAAPLNGRESNGLRGSDESFTNGHQATSTFPTTSSASGVWAQQSGPWNNVDHNAAARRTAVSPSPARQRDNSNDLSNSLPAAPAIFAIGQNGAYSNSRTKSSTNGASVDTSNGTYRYAPSLRSGLADGDADPNSITASLSNLGIDSEALPSRTRAAHSHNTSSVFAASSAAASVAGSATSTSAAPGPANGPVNSNGTSNGLPSFGSIGPIASSSHGHSHRTSLHTSTSYSSPAAPAHALPYHRNSQPEDANSAAMAQMFRQSQALDERTGGDSSLNGLGMGNGNLAAHIAYVQAQAQAQIQAQAQAQAQAQSQAGFQFNPISEPWDSGVRGYDLYSFGQNREAATAAAAAAAATATAFSNARGYSGAAERESTSIGGAFQPHSNSPRGLGTPANAGPWSRPQSRDPRMSGLPDSGANSVGTLVPRQPLQNYLHDQQLSAAVATAASYTGNTNYLPANLPYQYYNSFRAPMPMSPLGLPFGHPMGNPLISAPHLQAPRDGDVSKGMRTPLLEEFRASRTNKKFELKDIYNHFVEFSGDQHGSRFIQSKLETANSEDKEHIFREISADVPALMRDVFGNYVVQKFFEHGSQVQKKYLAEQMRGKMVELSTQAYACRVVQKALEYILVDQQILLVKELEADVTHVIKDPSGNHVIQKVIEVVPREHIGFVMDAFRGKVKELSSHNYGCRVVQRMLEHGSEDDKAAILAELHQNARELIMDQYGNYVIQHVIEFGKPEDCSRLINTVLNELVPMSRHKFASNVVEKCMQYGTVADRTRARQEMEKVGADGVPVLHQMIKDQYGNYVIQRLLKLLEGEECRQFVETMSTQLAVLRRTSTGRQNAAIERLMEELNKISLSLNNVGTPATTSDAASTAPVSPRLPANVAEATPPLTNTPNTPESSNPPSISAGPTGALMDAKVNDGSVSLDANTQTTE